ncbi:MAG: bifunctional histidinol-phosphatase/imidazoleglycerol-phosphate dehydratase HisB [Saprospiraceae bacterium]
MKKILFIDRDGVIIKEPADYQIDSIDKLEFLPGLFKYLGEIASKLDYIFVMVTNQDGLGTDSFPEKDFWPVQELILRSLANEGINFEQVCIDRSLPHENSPYRKPGTAMLTKYMTGQYDLENSYVIGDRATDIMLAKNLGSKSILLKNELHHVDVTTIAPTFMVKSWHDIYKTLITVDRKARLKRMTSETGIEGLINLDGNGLSEIKTGLPFFDHMLDQIAKHAQIDLFLTCKGDLHVDEHHTIEDSAIVLGKLFSEALGKKAGIQRYGFALPMDESQAQVLLDFGGRPWIVWDVTFSREKIGDMPTEMFYHFFKSFSDNALCNLNIKAEGSNEHHIIESVFKAFAKAILMAKTRNASTMDIPSTKGSL